MSKAIMLNPPGGGKLENVYYCEYTPASDEHYITIEHNLGFLPAVLSYICEDIKVGEPQPIDSRFNGAGIYTQSGINRTSSSGTFGGIFPSVYTDGSKVDYSGLYFFGRTTTTISIGSQSATTLHSNVFQEGKTYKIVLW